MTNDESRALLSDLEIRPKDELDAGDGASEFAPYKFPANTEAHKLARFAYCEGYADAMKHRLTKDEPVTEERLREILGVLKDARFHFYDDSPLGARMDALIFKLKECRVAQSQFRKDGEANRSE